MRHGSFKIGGAVEGQDIRVLSTLAREAWDTARAPLLHIVTDDHRFQTDLDLWAFFAPEMRVLAFPAWDCLPYDRVSPQSDILAQRTKVLAALAQEDAFKGPTVIVTPLNAAVQRMAAPHYFKNGFFSLKSGGKVNLESLKNFLAAQGYLRADTVREPGEFSLRG